MPPPQAGVQALRAWYYEFQGQTIGPVQQRVLATMLRHGQLSPETLVCEEESDQWRQAREVPLLQAGA